jgi:hypothetical protein
MNRATISPLIRCCIAACIALCATFAYLGSAYVVYTLMQHPAAAPVVKKNSVKNTTLRAQEKLEGIFLTADTAENIFEYLEAVATKNKVTIVVDHVSNPQGFGKSKTLPVTAVEAKVRITGEWGAIQQAARDLERMPVLTHIRDTEIVEEKDSQNPFMNVSLSFFILVPAAATP